MRYFVIQQKITDQNVIIGQRDLLYAYKAKNDLDTMYPHKATQTTIGQNYILPCKRKLMIEGM